MQAVSSWLALAFCANILTSALALHTGATTDVAEVVEQVGMPGKLTASVVKDLQGYLTHEKALPDPLPLNGDWDYRTQLALQKFLNKHGAGVSEDGSFGTSSIRGLQKFLNNNWDAAGGSSGKLWSDGSFGKKTVAAIKNYLRVKSSAWQPSVEDLETRNSIATTGKMDVATATALQRFLNSKNLLPEPLEITGDWDHRTKMALQTFLNHNGMGISVDGSFGMSSKRALQKFLNKNWQAAAFQASTLWTDGSFGEKTLKALQTYLNSKRLEWNMD